MVQYEWPWSGWLSLGIHIDFKQRTNAITMKKYGPYVDLHLLFAVISLGFNPYHSSEVSCNLGRGGGRDYA